MNTAGGLKCYQVVKIFAINVCFITMMRNMQAAIYGYATAKDPGRIWFR
jgi:hypothetical protein